MAIETQTSEIAIYYTLSKESITRVEGQARDTKKMLDRNMIIKLTADTINLQNSIAEMQTMLKKAKAEGDKNSKLIIQADLIHLKSQLTEAKRQLTNYMNTGEKALSRLQVKFNSVTAEIIAQKEELLRLGKNTSGIDKIIKQSETLYIKFQQGAISAKQFEKGINDLQKSTTLMNAIYTKAVDVIGNFVLEVGEKIKNLVSNIISLGTNLEQTKIAFTTMLRGADEAQKRLAELDNFAKNTPFSLLGVRDSARQLLAYGFSVQELIPTLKALGDVASGLGKPLDQIALAYGQVRTANQLYGTELRQFVQAGVPLLAELADMLGKDEAQIKKMTENGEIGFSHVEEAFRRMTSEGGIFNNLMQKQSETTKGQWEKLKDTFVSYGEVIGLKLLPYLTKLLEIINGVIEKFFEWEGTFNGIILFIKQLMNIISLLISSFFGFLGHVQKAILEIPILGGVLKQLGDAFQEVGKWIKDYIEWLNSAEEAELSQARATQIHEQAMRDLADEASDYLRKIQDLEKSGKKLTDEEEKRVKTYKNLVDNLKNARMELLKNDAINGETLSKIISIRAELENMGETEEEVAKLSYDTIQEQIEGYNTMQDEIATLQELLKASTPDTTAYETIKAELDAIAEKAGIAKAELVGTGVIIPDSGKFGDTKKSSGGGGKTAEQKRLEKEEKAVDEWLKKEINALKKLNLAQKDYVDRAKKIYSEAEDKKFKLSATEVELEEKSIEEIEKKLEAEKEAEENINEILEKRVEKIEEEKDVYITAVEDMRETTEDAMEDIQGEIDDTIDKIIEIGQKWEELHEKTGSELAKRSLGINDELIKSEEKLLELRGKGIDTIENQYLLQEDFLKSLQANGNSEVNGFNIKDLLDYIEEQGKVLELNQENQKIQDYINKEGNEHLKELYKINEQYESMSKAEQIIADFETQKTTYEQERELRMQELEEKREELEIETNYWRDLGTAKELIEEKYKDKVEGIEKSITDTIYKETEQRKKYLKELEAQAIATANALKQAGMSGTSSVASASNGNTNNSSVNNFSFGDTIINNEADMDAFTDVIVDKVTQANKGIY